MSVARIGRLLRKPPRYVVARAFDEVRRRLLRVALLRAKVGRGSLAPGRLPSNAAGARERTLANAVGLVPWQRAIAMTKSDSALVDNVRDRRARVGRDELELFGEGPTTVTRPRPWLSDPHSGFAWAPQWAPGIDYVNRGRPSDVKAVWELSRLRDLVALAQATAVLGDEDALQTIDADVSDWIAANPVGWTVNWSVGMEIALRAVNLVCVDGMLGAAGNELRNRHALVDSLYQHGWYLSRNLEISDVNGNHYLANAVGLLWLGRYFEGIGEAAAWQRKGYELCRDAAREQILADGLDHEGSLPYHFLVLELFVLAAVAAPPCADLPLAIERMAGAAEAVLAPTGEVPDIGDDDGGRVCAFCDAPSRDGHRVISAAAALLGRPAAIGPQNRWPQDAIWLTGGQPPLVDPPAKPLNLPDGGVVVLGGGLDHVVLDWGSPGFRGRGGHGHLDAMSFVASIAGHPAIRDSGTASYTGDPELRNRLRDAEAHSTVVMDGRRYATLGGVDRLWAIDGTARPSLMKLVQDEDDEHLVQLRFVVPCDGGTATWDRTLRWRPGVLSWTDSIVAPAGSQALQTTQLPFGTEPVAEGFRAPGLIYSIALPPGADIKLVEAPYSDRYGWSGVAPRAEVHFGCPTGLVTIGWQVSAAHE